MLQDNHNLEKSAKSKHKTRYKGHVARALLVLEIESLSVSGDLFDNRKGQERRALMQMIRSGLKRIY